MLVEELKKSLDEKANVIKNSTMEEFKRLLDNETYLTKIREQALAKLIDKLSTKIADEIFYEHYSQINKEIFKTRAQKLINDMFETIN